MYSVLYITLKKCACQYMLQSTNPGYLKCCKGDGCPKRAQSSETLLVFNDTIFFLQLLIFVEHKIVILILYLL